MSSHAQKFGGNFPQIFVVKFEKNEIGAYNPEIGEKRHNFVHSPIFGGWQPPKIGTLFNSASELKEIRQLKSHSFFFLIL